MDKSNSEELQASGGEGGNQRDEQPTTSREENSPDPVRNSHNMNDFKLLDFNSADEVRQAMKAVLNGHPPQQSFTEEANQAELQLRNKPAPVEITEVPNKANPHNLRNTVQRQIQRNLYLKTMSTANTNTKRRTKTDLTFSGLRRRGRPMKAGPSRTVKIATTRKSVFYIGKLSNVVQFKRRWASESGSDADSVIFY